MEYIQVTFTFSQIEDYQKDLLIDELAAINFDTFDEIDNGFIAYIAKNSFQKNDLEALLSNLDGDIIFTHKVEEIVSENWNIEWEKNFSPLNIDDKCYVRATFHESLPNFEYEIVIDPKMAFGTGHHQTTSMMLQYILETDFTDKNVLDMGCGTGILAFLAGKKGAKKLVAIDFDEVCYESTLENAALNNISNITAICGGKEVIPNEMYEVILANINRNILLDQIETYAKVLKKEGKIFFSGFYETPDLIMIIEECSKFGIKYINHKKNGDWVAAQFIKS
ncbi:MAG: 50S ribosomal protein L11 methyltransferase [Sphingobacteriaceae bacterium]|nr:50S ribosomal protein L11 methyltransferase [Sphingobacteriaceae bacterium]